MTLCRIKQDELITSPPLRTKQADMRDLATLDGAHSDFISKGNGDLRVTTKEYYDVIGMPFFRIPLDQAGTNMV